MKLKLLILMILALTVTACEENKGISTSYVEDLEARVSVLEKKLNIICDKTKGYDYLDIQTSGDHYHEVIFDKDFCGEVE